MKLFRKKSKKATEAEVSDSLPYNEDIPQNTKATVNRLFKRLGRQKAKLIIVACATLFSSSAYALMPLMAGSAIDNLLSAIKNYNGTDSVMMAATHALLIPVLLLIGATAVNSLMSYIQQYIIASVGEHLTLSLRQDISAKINRLPLSYYDSHKTGEIMSRVTTDLEKVSDVMQVGLMQFISSAFTIILTVVAMVLLSPGLSLLVLAAVAASALATKTVSRLDQHYYAENLAAMSALGGKVEELYAGNRIIKVFNQQPKAIEELLELNERQFRANRKAQFTNYAIYPFIRLINQLGFIATAIAGGLMALRGSISIGTVQAFLQYVNQISEPVTQSSYIITSLQSAIAGAERVFAMLDEPEEVADTALSSNGGPELLLPRNQETPLRRKIQSGRVTFSNVQFGYTPDRMLIHNLSLEVKPNEMVAIVGPTGGGKTTLINLLMRFYELNKGHISIDGTNITQMTRQELRRSIGMVLQDTWLFEGTIADNIAYGKMDASRQEIEAAAKAACCHHFIHTLPQGYDTIISSEASSVSQGQMQLLTIARAMLTNPAIMILDEATSSVDTRTEKEIQKAMNRLMKDKTSFVIAHRLSTIQNADLILVVKDGDIIERGTHDNLLAQDGFYAALYNSQFEEVKTAS